MFTKKKQITSVNDAVLSLADIVGGLQGVSAHQTAQEELHTAIAQKAEDAARRAAQEALRADKIAAKIEALIT